MPIIGILLLILCIVVVSSIITAKIIIVHYFKVIDDYLANYDKQIMDLIRWAKGLDKS